MDRFVTSVCNKVSRRASVQWGFGEVQWGVHWGSLVSLGGDGTELACYECVKASDARLWFPALGSLSLHRQLGNCNISAKTNRHIRIGGLEPIAVASPVVISRRCSFVGHR